MSQHSRVRSGPVHIDVGGTRLSLVVECDVRDLLLRGDGGRLYRPCTLYVISNSGVSAFRIRYLAGTYWPRLLRPGRKRRPVRRPAAGRLKVLRSEAEREPLGMVMGEPALDDGRLFVPLRAVLATGGSAIAGTRGRYRLRRATTLTILVESLAGR